LLQCIAEGDGEFSLRSLAQRLRLPPSTVHRLLRLLLDTHMIERAQPDVYRPGRELFRLASLLVQQFDIQKVAQPVLRDLWVRWQETCSLCLYRAADRTAAVFATIPSPQPLQFVIDASTPLSLTWGSLGRSILAHLPGEDIDAVLAQKRRSPLSGRPVPSKPKLLSDLQRIRRLGYALYEDRRGLDVAGVAAPVFGPTGRVLGCVGISMPASRFKSSQRPKLAAAVVESAARLSAAMGFREPAADLPLGAPPLSDLRTPV
jgi:DNA-binding IclR family transcriptional regulator